MKKSKENIQMQAIQKRLQEVISESKIHQKIIAANIGVSEQTVSKYMNCNVFPSPDTFAKLCAFLDVSADYILGLKDY